MLKRMMMSRHIYWGVTLASALESTVVPVPFEFLLIPLMQANRRKLWRLAVMALTGCVIGALIGYAAGYAMYETAGRWIVSLTASGEQFENARQALRENAFGFIFTVGISPVPFQTAMAAAGAAGCHPAIFLGATALSRFLRYFSIAALVWSFGDNAEKIVRKHKAAAIVATTSAVLIYWILFGIVF